MNKLSIILGVLLVIAIGAAGFFWWQTQQQDPGQALGPYTPFVSETPAPHPSVQSETANWKTYSNSDFGVSFKYPSDIFIYQATPKTDSQYWSNKTNGGAPLELGADGLWLNLLVTKLDDVGYSYYQTMANSENWTIAHDQPKPNSERAYGYSASQLRGRTLYRFTIGAFTDEKLQEYKPTFDQILSTFEFTNTNN